MVSVFDEQLGVHITPRLRRCMIEGVVPSKAGAQHHVDLGQRITHITHRLVQPGWCALQTCTRDQQRPRERPTGIDRHCCYTICFVTKMKPEFHSLLLVRATFGRTAYLDVAKNSRVQRSFWLSAFHNVNTVPMRTSPHAPDERSLPRCRTKARSNSTRLQIEHT